MNRIEVELVEHTPGAPYSGIGRYTRELYRRLAPHVPAHLTTQIDLPFAIGRLAFLHHLPIGIRAHHAGHIAHFMEDLGCSQMLWRPVRPAIATSHDLGALVWPPEAKMHRPLDLVIWRLSYLGLKRMDAIITVSEFSRQMLIQRLRIPAERVFTIHSGIETLWFMPVACARAQLASRYGLPDGASYKYLLYVGTEIPRKNLATMFKALAQLPPSVRLLKVGAAGGQRFRQATNRLIAEMGLAERVLFFDQVSDEDLRLLYNAADVYLCCSYLEGFGQPILEAMACGTPVVCSNTTSLPEVAGDAAMLFPPSNTDAIVGAVVSVLEDSNRREQLVKRGLMRANSYSWDETATRVAEVYRRVAATAA